MSRVTQEARTNRTRPNPGFPRQSAPAHRRARPLRAFPLALKKEAASCFLRMSSCSQHIQVFSFLASVKQQYKNRHLLQTGSLPVSVVLFWPGKLGSREGKLLA